MNKKGRIMIEIKITMMKNNMAIKEKNITTIIIEATMAEEEVITEVEVEVVMIGKIEVCFIKITN
jgi:hypothetical protein